MYSSVPPFSSVYSLAAAKALGRTAHVSVGTAGIAPQLATERAGAAPHQLTYGPQATALLV